MNERIDLLTQSPKERETRMLHLAFYERINVLFRNG